MADDPGDEPPAEDPSKKYNQDFFLALAAKGKDAWNAWRRDPANKDVFVTFAGIDFLEAPRDKINFSGFEFGDSANFSDCKWRGVEWFEIRSNPKAFAPGRAYFAGATFSDETRFIAAAFGDYGDFSGAAFGHVVHFTGAAFGDCADFSDTAFGDYALFSGAILGYYAVFAGASFDHLADFKNTVFNGRVEFTGKPKEQRTGTLASVQGVDIRAAREKRYKESGPDRFLTISFANAHFGVDAHLEGAAIFSGRSFEQIADFTNARFYSPPIFDNVSNATRIDFTGAHIGFVRPGKLAWTDRSEVSLRLRALRKIAEETKNHDLERDLYIEERKAERGVYWCQWQEVLKKEPNWALKGIALLKLFHAGLWIFVMSLYWILADYGRSLMRPFGALIASGFFFFWSYTKVLAQLMVKAPDIEKYKQALRMLALGNTVPFVGPLTIDSKVKEFLFCPWRNCPDPLIPPEGYQLLVLGQNLFSIICVFFIGLALRNYFRIK